MKKWITIIGAAALIGVGFLISTLLHQSPKVTVSATSIAEKLSECSDLATARLDYRGIVHYSEGEIPLINQKSFSMIYDAHIKAGIDLSVADVKVEGSTITVKVPKAEVQEIVIDSDSLEFYDEKLALFNWTEREDTKEALKYAQEDAESKVDQTELLKEASVQAKTLIENLIIPVKDGQNLEYKIVFQEIDS